MWVRVSACLSVYCSLILGLYREGLNAGLFRRDGETETYET